MRDPHRLHGSLEDDAWHSCLAILLLPLTLVIILIGAIAELFPRSRRR